MPGWLSRDCSRTLLKATRALEIETELAWCTGCHVEAACPNALLSAPALLCLPPGGRPEDEESPPMLVNGSALVGGAGRIDGPLELPLDAANGSAAGFGAGKGPCGLAPASRNGLHELTMHKAKRSERMPPQLSPFLQIAGACNALFFFLTGCA